MSDIDFFRRGHKNSYKPGMLSRELITPPNYFEWFYFINHQKKKKKNQSIWFRLCTFGRLNKHQNICNKIHLELVIYFFYKSKRLKIIVVR